MKKVVTFLGEPEFYEVELPDFEQEEFGKYATNNKITLAWVYAQNHPRLGKRMVRTSIVVKRYKNGNFDTLNTQYKKMLDK